MANIALQRIQRDYKEFDKPDDEWTSGIKVTLIDDSFFHLRGEIKGPPDTPYEGGTFFIDVEIPQTYPFHPPKMKFITKIWHPNISSATGAICLDILKDQWAASMTLRTVFLSIQALLCSPEPDDPQDAVVARQYKDDIRLFSETARNWSQRYASAAGQPNSDFNSRIQLLKEMGVEENNARVALSSCGWDVSRATEMIFS